MNKFKTLVSISQTFVDANCVCLIESEYLWVLCKYIDVWTRHFGLSESAMAFGTIAKLPPG